MYKRQIHDHFPVSIVVKSNLTHTKPYYTALHDVAKYVLDNSIGTIGYTSVGCSYSLECFGYGYDDGDFTDGVVYWSTPPLVDAGSALPASIPTLVGGPPCRPACGDEVRGADGIPLVGKRLAVRPPCLQRSCWDDRGAGTHVSVPTSRSRKRRDRAKRVRLSLRELAGTSLGASLGHGSVRDPSAVVPCGRSSEYGGRLSGPLRPSCLSFAEQGCPRLPRLLTLDVSAILVAACFLLFVSRRSVDFVMLTLFPTTSSYIYIAFMISCLSAFRRGTLLLPSVVSREIPSTCARGNKRSSMYLVLVWVLMLSFHLSCLCARTARAVGGMCKMMLATTFNDIYPTEVGITASWHVCWTSLHCPSCGKFWQHFEPHTCLYVVVVAVFFILLVGIFRVIGKDLVPFTAAIIYEASLAIALYLFTAFLFMCRGTSSSWHSPFGWSCLSGSLHGLGPVEFRGVDGGRSCLLPEAPSRTSLFLMLLCTLLVEIVIHVIGDIIAWTCIGPSFSTTCAAGALFSSSSRPLCFGSAVFAILPRWAPTSLSGMASCTTSSLRMGSSKPHRASYPHSVLAFMLIFALKAGGFG